jgi:hypothetical protein
VCVCVCTCVCVCATVTYTHTHVHTHVHTHTHIGEGSKEERTHTHTHTYIYTHVGRERTDGGGIGGGTDSARVGGGVWGWVGGGVERSGNGVVSDLVVAGPATGSRIEGFGGGGGGVMDFSAKIVTNSLLGLGFCLYKRKM